MDDTTDVMSLDELMDLAAESPARSTPRPAPIETPLTTQLTRPVPRPTPQPQQAKPARTEPGQGAMLAARIQADGRRMLVDVRRASANGFSMSREWLETSDNALIAATVLLTLLLLIIVGTL